MKGRGWAGEVITVVATLRKAPSFEGAKVGAVVAVAYAILDLADAVRTHARPNTED